MYFYPAAMTPGCTKQACDFSDSIDRLQAEGYTVLGISPDKPEKLAKFRERDGLTITLLSDPAQGRPAGVGRVRREEALRQGRRRRHPVDVRRRGRHDRPRAVQRQGHRPRGQAPQGPRPRGIRPCRYLHLASKYGDATEVHTRPPDTTRCSVNLCCWGRSTAWPARRRRHAHAHKPRDQEFRSRYVAFHALPAWRAPNSVVGRTGPRAPDRPKQTPKACPSSPGADLSQVSRTAVQRAITTDTWFGSPLTLDVDHIDGDFHNNQRANLRFLCPNCHRQTPNFAGRSRGRFGSTGHQTHD